jgi:hypothetical protein
MHQPVEYPDNPNIRFVRMNTGEDLITEVIETKVNEQDAYLFVSPLKIVYLIGEKPGSMMLSLIEWVFPKISPKQEFLIYPDDVITISDVSDSLLDYYHEALYKLDNKVSIDREGKGKPVSSLDDIHNMDSEMPSEDELEYIKNFLEDLSKGNKRKLH